MTGTQRSSNVTQAEAAKYLLKLKKSSESFMDFMDYYYPDMEWAWFQRELQEVLDLLEKDALMTPGGNPIRNVLINMPPRHAKSFNSTINFPAYCLMRKAYREIMVSSYNNDLANTFGRGTREIVLDPRARRAFKGFELSKETRAVDFWKTTAGGAYYSVGLGGTTTGRGANGLFVDDPYKSREEADSTTQRRKVWDFYTAGLLSRRQPDRDGQPAFRIVTQTRWHPDDMAGRIIESPEFKRGEWVHLNYEALRKKERGVYVQRNKLPKDDPRYIPNVTAQQIDTGERLEDKKDKLLSDHLVNPKVRVDDEVEALWPSRFPVKWLQEQRGEIGDREFESLYQQNPYILGGNIIKDDWFKRYTPETMPEFHALAVGVDTAFKTKEVNDYSVFSVGGITESGDIYLLKVFRQKLEFPDLKRKAIAINAAYRGQGLRGFWIEDNASGQSLIQELRNNSGVPVIPWKPGSADKVMRMTSITPLVEAGRVYIPEEADWLDDWLSEMVAFPSVKNDDQADSFVILIDVLSRMVISGLKEFHAPIGELVGANGSGIKDLMFAGAPLAADPNGWSGKGGFQEAAGGGFKWNGWGM
jgi:predicted phage terminase large subunit-like protein